MKNAALTLAVAGGILALILGCLSLIAGVGIAQYGAEVRTQDNLEPDAIEPSDYVFIAPGILCMLGGVAGIAGGVFTPYKKWLAASLMIAGACLSIPSIIGIIACIPLLLGGIFALIRENKPDAHKEEK